MSTSMFDRLFTFARTTEQSPIENFTTEALAVCIRTEPTPLIKALERRGVNLPVPRGASIMPTTQVVIPGTGIVDMIVTVVHDSIVVAEVWIEAKVWAEQSGDQLARYQTRIAAMSDGIPRSLVVIGPRPLAGADVIPWVSWQGLRDEIARSPVTVPLWQEFSAFLEERKVADVGPDPITAREATSLTEAHSMFKKATFVLGKVNALGESSFPDWGWANGDQVAQLVLGQFQRHARYTLPTRSSPIYLVVGYTDLHGTGEAHASVWVESNPRKIDVRAAMHRAADDGGLAPSWTRRLDVWQGLAITRRATTLESADDAVEWFTDRLSELAKAGVRPDEAAP